MLKKCTLVVFAGGECFGFPAVNFPMLPEGSKLTLYLGEVVIENVEIESYHVCNKRGTVVDLECIDKDVFNHIAPTPEQLQELFVESDQGLTEYTYPETIDFNI